MLNNLTPNEDGTYNIKVNEQQLIFVRKAIERVDKHREYAREYEKKKRENQPEKKSIKKIKEEKKRGVGRPRKNIDDLV